jgi:hypothetical protein
MTDQMTQRVAWIFLGVFWLALAILVAVEVIPLHPLWVSVILLMDSIPYWAKLAREGHRD